MESRSRQIYVDSSVPPPENWDRHHYNPESVICDTSEAFCTLENVWCWAKRWPAPRQSGSEHVVDDEEAVLLKGGHPIATWVDDANRRFVNETLGAPTHPDLGEIGAHIFHDPLQSFRCGDGPAGTLDPKARC